MLRRTSRLLAFVLGPALAVGCASEPLVDLAEGRPHVILIALDTFRADHLGVYGNPGVQTPVLDRFANEAIVFERCASTAAWTLPAFASLFTGLLPYHHGAIGGPRYSKLAEDQLTLAELLGESGYTTYAFVAVDFLTGRFGMNQGFAFTEEYVSGKVTGRMKRYQPKVLGLLGRARRTPMFLLAHYFDVHSPYDPPSPFAGMYYEGDPRDSAQSSIEVIYDPERNRTERDPQKYYAWLEGITDLEYPVRQYAAGVTHLDHELASLFDTLRSTGLMDRSIVIVVGDHGEHLTEHDLYFTHRLPYQEALHVPLMVRLPHAVGAGRRVTEDVSLVDVVPTLMELLGLDAPADCDGLSLVDLMRGKKELSRPHVFAEHGGRPGNMVKAVWNDRYRMIRFHTDGREWTELYDRERDPAETTDLAGTLPEVEAELAASIDARFAPESPLVGLAPGQELVADPEVDARLRALGYID